MTLKLHQADNNFRQTETENTINPFLLFLGQSFLEPYKHNNTDTLPLSIYFFWKWSNYPLY